MRIYLDNCCLNRPFDDQSHSRIRLEAESVVLILALVEQGKYEWTGSAALKYEVQKTPDVEKRRRMNLLISHIKKNAAIGNQVTERANKLRTLGFTAMDALHIACAEHARADIFFTTDDELLKIAEANADALKIQVYNPLFWLREVYRQ